MLCHEIRTLFKRLIAQPTAWPGEPGYNFSSSRILTIRTSMHRTGKKGPPHMNGAMRPGVLRCCTENGGEIPREFVLKNF
jgi:hypothetical protein